MTRASIVLIHGAWGGKWIRQRVLDAMVPRPRKGWGELHSVETVAQRSTAAAVSDHAPPHSIIDCTASGYPTIEAMRQRVRTLPGFDVITMQTGHCPIVTEPALLAQHLLRIAAR